MLDDNLALQVQESSDMNGLLDPSLTVHCLLAGDLCPLPSRGCDHSCCSQTADVVLSCRQRNVTYSKYM